ncbi:SubName: Full=Uncharacterized protein {ECO:0000313/EMBL:CCA75815.1} [Serendipita indica DSM 11827]|uniref:Uncharacterized protein n=1 Tax=Serendipita indica (strain DSM 11827) TaxID=1109443 RepID=G4TWX2_SERID|nr:SubName: Full=Uncharacterized protein {ECO:0000313/EMBL:CCA75815.1} [Serendipita indica DSM 11827]CCA75815.1 hypothetical protein PIIN_09803 [Serendipita indica DSM 11827]
MIQTDWFTYEGERRQMRRHPSLQDQVLHVRTEFGIPVTTEVSLLVDWVGHVFPATNETFDSLSLGSSCLPCQEFIVATSPIAAATLTVATLKHKAHLDAGTRSKARRLSTFLRPSFFYIRKAVQKVRRIIIGRKPRPNRVYVVANQQYDIASSYIRSNRTFLQQLEDNLKTQTQKARKGDHRVLSTSYPEHVEVIEEEEEFQFEEAETIHTTSQTSIHTVHFDQDPGIDLRVSRFEQGVEPDILRDEVGNGSVSEGVKGEMLSEFGMLAYPAA